MAKLAKNPKDIKVKTSKETPRSKSYVGSIVSQKGYQDKSKILKGKTPGQGLGNYTLDLMKLK